MKKRPVTGVGRHGLTDLTQALVGGLTAKFAALVGGMLPFTVSVDVSGLGRRGTNFRER